MIDDLLTLSHCGVDSITSNSITNSFIESKRLEMGPKKSHRIHFGKKSNGQSCVPLQVHGKPMNDTDKAKYVGDIISATGGNIENILDRKRKAFALAGQILAILD